MHAIAPDQRRPSVLYMSYDGLLDPVAESQVVGYLEVLSDSYDIHLVSFEKPGDPGYDEKIAAMAARLRTSGIRWYPRRYHKHPKIVSTVWDMAAAMLLAVRLARRHQVALLHARSVLCAAMLYPALWIGRPGFLVDIRGFWADERVDGGMIPAGGLVHRVLKRLEKAMLHRADHIVTVTRASVPYLRDDERFGRPTAPITVIPTCTDLVLFSPGPPKPAGPLTIGYIGQIGTWYMLDDMRAFFAAVRRRCADARLLLVNRSQQDALRAAVARAGIDPDAVEITASARHDIPVQIRRMDAAMALIHPYFSKIGAAPVKLAEYLGCGVPVVGNVGCGDMAQIIKEDRVGVAMTRVGPDAIEAAADALLERLPDPALPGRCVTTAHRYFSLKEGAARFRDIYRQLIVQP